MSQGIRLLLVIALLVQPMIALAGDGDCCASHGDQPEAIQEQTSPPADHDCCDMAEANFSSEPISHKVPAAPADEDSTSHCPRGLCCNTNQSPSNVQASLKYTWPLSITGQVPLAAQQRPLNNALSINVPPPQILPAI